ncbi:solute carrier family 52, riboflavin transporter, member 3-B-like [Culicoides brevitarsis]|uniref:solute carrier family 52, riboflavin transporter, member 3-B-like n=1 Tax=Culicoides brevitarsis TaxID=469753 RepID=UPI00307C6BF9
MTLSGLLQKICPFFFGISTWLGIYATFTQMPIIVNTAPEGWNLPSYVVVMIQIGNLGPLLYHFLQKHRPVKDSYLIYGMLTLGFCGALLFSQLWDLTTLIFDKERSLSLLGSVLMFSFMACTSSVLFMPYMGRFPSSYIVQYFTGVSFGGLICAFLALVQGMGSTEEKLIATNETESVTEEPQMQIDQPNFSVSTFFLLISGILFVSGIAFYLMDTLEIFKKQYANVEIRYGNDYTFNSAENEEMRETNDEDKRQQPRQQLKKLSPINYRNLLLLFGVMSAVINAIIPSVLSYATLPFGSNTYHYTITVVYIMEPLAYIFGNFIPHSSIRAVWIVAFIPVLPCTYLMINAVMSPYPWLLGTTIGEILPIISWSLVKMSNAFVTISLMSIFRDQGGKSLVNIGSYTQIGSFLGSVFIFCLVNFTDIFKSL